MPASSGSCSVELGGDYAFALIDVGEDGVCTFTTTWCGSFDGQRIVVPLSDVEEWIWRVSRRAGVNLRAMVDTRSVSAAVQGVRP